MAIAYSYIRFSTLTQRVGRSVERQLTQCLAWCDRNGIALSEDTFKDEGFSAYTGDNLAENAQLRRFIRLVDEGKIARGSFLIVESLDRLSRQNVWTAVSLLMSLVEKGIRVVTLINERVYSDAGDERDLMLSIVELSRAHDESRTKSIRAQDVWKSKLLHARESGRPVGRQVAKWLQLTSEGYVVREDRVAVVKRIFDLCINGYGAVSISKTLNNEKVPAFRANGTWSTSSVLELLKNRRVLGEWEPADGQGKIEDYFPRIIDEETWGRAHLAMDLRRRTKSTKQTKNFQVWQGVARCAYCDSAMHLNVKGDYRYLACSNRRKGLCAAKPVRADECEAVFSELMTHVGSLSLIETESASILDELESANAAILMQERALARHMEAADSPEASLAVYRLIKNAEEKLHKLETKKAELETELSNEKANREDKNWFLKRLELNTYAGRSKANGFLRRQAITVLFLGPSYLVMQSHRPILALGYHEGRALYTPLNEAQIKRVMAYGEYPFSNGQELPSDVQRRAEIFERSMEMLELIESLGLQKEPNRS